MRRLMLGLALIAALFTGVTEADAHRSGYECWSHSLYYVEYDAYPIQPYWAGNHTHNVIYARNLYTSC